MKELLLCIILSTTLLPLTPSAYVQQDKQVFFYPTSGEEQIMFGNEQQLGPQRQPTSGTGQQHSRVQQQQQRQHHQKFPSESQRPPTRLSDISEVVTRFSWNVFHGAKLPNDSNNLILSPIMIQIMLSTLEKAAVGETERQLQQVIGPFKTENLLKLLTSSRGKSQASLELASGMFVDSIERLNRTFIREAKRNSVDVVPVQFQNDHETRQQINQWASDATHGLIKNLLSESYNIKDLELVLASAIYFRSSWKYRFNTSVEKTFYTENEIGRPVPFMEVLSDLVWEEMNIDNEIRGRFVEVPYENDAYSMVILLPENEYSLDGFIRSITSEDLANIVKTIRQSAPRRITLKMPKFEISTRFSVVNSLLKMGLVDLFTLNSKLPYIGLSDDPKVSDILQQAVLKVDENGTTASAATASLLIPLSADSTNEDMIIVDRPFLSIIFDKTAGIPIFISKIYNP